jgi:glycosyltransferase involved in cell wall biosynthesis
MPRPLRLFFDCRAVTWPHHDGISRYTTELVTALARLTPVTMLIEDERQLVALPDLPWERVPGRTSPLDAAMALYVNRLGADILFSPMQTIGSIGRRYRLVLTVHDLIYYTHRTPPPNLPLPVRLLWRLYHLSWWPQRLKLNRADAVAVVSRTTWKRVLESRLTRRPLILAPNGMGLSVGDGTVVPHGERLHDLVYMGSFMPYKNVETLVRAMNRLPEYRLHLMSRVSPRTRRRLRSLSRPGNIVFHDGASDEEYLLLLRRATALVTASLDEGFGIPLVEAMALGTPVVVSDIEIFHEIAGSAGTYVDPRDPSSVASGIRALEDAGLWAARSAASVETAARWNWDAAARSLLTGLQQVMARRD